MSIPIETYKPRQSAIIRVNGTLNGWLSPGASATSPGDLNIGIYSNLNSGNTTTFTITTNGGSSTYGFGPSDPGGDVYVGVATGTNADATSLATAITADGGKPSGISATDNGDGSLTISNSNVGSAYYTQISASGDMSISEGPNYGGDATDPTGAVTSVTLLAGVPGKKTKLVNMFLNVDGTATWNGDLNLAFFDYNGSYNFGTSGAFIIPVAASGFSGLTSGLGTGLDFIVQFSPASSDLTDNMAGGQIEITAFVTQD